VDVAKYKCKHIIFILRIGFFEAANLLEVCPQEIILNILNIYGDVNQKTMSNATDVKISIKTYFGFLGPSFLKPILFSRL